ncbi:MAG TPA: 50S ribosomal protein L9 [Anaerolineae bacterium]
MQILLTHDVPGVGKAGDVKKVSDGYARNFLFPKKLAVLATSDSLTQSEHIKKAQDKRHAETLAEAQALAAELESVALLFRVKAGEGDRLFGSITPGDIAERLQSEHRVVVDKRKIELDAPIKTLGEHRVAVKLHPEVAAHVSVRVEKE